MHLKQLSLKDYIKISKHEIVNFDVTIFILSLSDKVRKGEAMLKTGYSVAEQDLLEINEIKNISTDINLMNKSSSLPVVIECDNHLVTLNIKEAKCALGQLIFLKGKMHFKVKSDVGFSFVGKIIQLLVSDDGSSRMTIKLNQYDKDLWKKFLNQIRRRQASADRVLNIIKGDDDGL